MEEVDYTSDVERGIWEIDNQQDIIGWEVSNAKCMDKKADIWEWYKGYSVIIFSMKDGTKKEFKRMK